MNYPELVHGLEFLPCAIRDGMLYIPHADGNWVSAARLQPFSLAIIECWRAEQATAPSEPEAQKASRAIVNHGTADNPKWAPEAQTAVAEVVGTYNIRTLKFLSAGIHLPLGTKLYASPSPAASMEVQGLDEGETDYMIGNWYAEQWAQEKARDLLHEYFRALAAKNGWRLGGGQ